MSRIAYALITLVALALSAILVLHNRALQDALDATEHRLLTVTVPQSDPCPKRRPSKLAKQYLESLRGVEIGASTENSFWLPRAMNVDVFDESQTAIWQSKACKPATVHILASGDNLPFKNGTLDYVLSSHAIEHFFDPIKALKEWHRVIRPGGYIFIIVPHKDRTFDSYRETTSLSELIARHEGRIRLADYAKPDVQHPEKNKMEFHLLLKGGNVPRGWARYKEDDYHHWSVWRTQDFVRLIAHLGMTIVEVQDTDDKVGNGFTIVIGK